MRAAANVVLSSGKEVEAARSVTPINDAERPVWSAMASADWARVKPAISIRTTQTPERASKPRVEISSNRSLPKGLVPFFSGSSGISIGAQDVRSSYCLSKAITSG